MEQKIMTEKKRSRIVASYDESSDEEFLKRAEGKLSQSNYHRVSRRARNSDHGIIEFPRLSSLPTDSKNAINLLTEEIELGSFPGPIIIRNDWNVSVPGMQIDSNLTVNRVVKALGSQYPVQVMEVCTQDQLSEPMVLSDWYSYFEEKTPEERNGRLLNVISLEISHCKELVGSWRRPFCVDKTDLISRYWPETITEKTGKYPKVSWYCLMTVKDAFTDFHIDFGGSSVFYHLVKGRKRFYFVPPTDESLKMFERWNSSLDQNRTFFPDLVGETFQVDMEAGDTLFLPSGWIHAVYTPEDSLIIGGNFLHDKSLPRILDCWRLENRLRLPQMFRLPFFEELMWFTAIFWRPVVSGHDEDLLETSCNNALSQFLGEWLYQKNRKKVDIKKLEYEINLVLACLKPQITTENDFSCERFLLNFRERLIAGLSSLVSSPPAMTPRIQISFSPKPTTQ